MLATVTSAALTCVAALLLGQGLLLLCGHRSWSWQAPAVGIACLMVLAVPALHLPGRTGAAAAGIALLAIAALVAMVREPALRPPAAGLLAGVPVALLALVPFAAAGRSGTLGVGFDNDMASHLLEATAYASADVARVTSISDSYPLGLHAVAATLATGLHVAIDHAFAGAMVAIPVLLGWTALGAVRRAGVLGGFVVATLTAMSFLVAGFYGEGAFKEVVLATLLLGLTLVLLPDGRPSGRLRWGPAGALLAGMLSVYSYTALLWAGAIVAAWLAGLVVSALRRGGLARVPAVARDELGPLLLGGAAFLLLVVPQLPRLLHFYNAVGEGLDTSALGNLVARLPFWETFGIWDVADFRLPPLDPLATGAWAALVLALAVYGAGWCARRGDWALSAAAGATFVVWFYVNRTQSPYLASKALVLLSPFVLLLAVRPLIERRSWQPSAPRWRGLAAPLLVLVLAGKVLGSSVDALRASPVGPRDHRLELAALREQVLGRPTLFLGNDDFVRWELAGVPTYAAVIGFPTLPLRPEKAWEYGQAIDVDTVESADLNRVAWVIAPRDAAASAMPPQLQLVRRTRDFDLWRRTGTVPDREILPEHRGVAAVRLDCRRPRGRALARRAGVAGVRTLPITVPAPTIPPGGEAVVRIALPAGRWALMAPYASTFPVHVSAAGLATTLPPNLDRPGPRWPIGSVRLSRLTVLSLRIRVDDTALSLSPPTAVAFVNAIVAARLDDARVVPLHNACGRYVDWYRLSGRARTVGDAAD
jgi:hypothetical protein